MSDYPSEYAAFLRNFSDAQAKMARLKICLSSYEEENREFVRLVLGTSLADSIGKYARTMQSARIDLQAKDEEIKKLSLIEEYNSLSRKKAILSDPWPQLLSLLKKTGAKGTDAVSLSLIGGDIDHAVETYRQQVSRLSKQANDQSALEKKLVLSDGKYSKQYQKNVEASSFNRIRTLSQTKSETDFLTNESDSYLSFKSNLDSVRVGGIIKLGTYPQEVPFSIRTPIQWQILAKKGNRILAISRFALDKRQYSTGKSGTTWENSDIRDWLNDTFFSKVFSQTERSMIVETTINTERAVFDKNSVQTRDKVFLLSVPEAQHYFPRDEKRNCKLTQFAARKRGKDGWWLRSRGEKSNYAAVVSDLGGRILESGSPADMSHAVRPAIWIELP